MQILTAAALCSSPSPAYEFSLCSATPDEVTISSLFRPSLVQDIAAADDADILLAPNRASVEVAPSPVVIAALQRAHQRGARLFGCWSGAFTLAEAGLLDGRRATTHWQWANTFRNRYPKVRYEPDVLFVDDGDVLTGAGGTSVIDLSLHLVRRDFGVDVANAVGDELLVGNPRQPSHPQRLTNSLPQIEADSLAPLMDWARARLEAKISVSEMAALAAVSEATLYRRFRIQTGGTPLAWLTNERVGLARLLLERGEPSLDRVAQRAGLGTATNLRELLRRATGLSPSQYRQRFATRSLAER